jgi:hypothetical protein
MREFCSCRFPSFQHYYNIANLRRRLVTFAAVAWKETPGRVPIEVEAELIEQFRLTYGKPPFANDPHRLGL